MHELSLHPVTQDNWREALRLTVHPEQLRFVAAYEPISAIALSKAYVGLGGARWLPFAVCAHEATVGFLELALWPDAPQEVWLFHFFIDREYQGRGYGKAALAALLQMLALEWPERENVLLVVHPENHRARQLYVRAGFRPTGAERFGEPVFHLSLRDRR